MGVSFLGCLSLRACFSGALKNRNQTSSESILHIYSEKVFFFFKSVSKLRFFFFLLVDQSLNLSRDGKMERVYVAAPAGRVGYSSCRK